MLSLQISRENWNERKKREKEDKNENCKCLGRRLVLFAWVFFISQVTQQFFIQEMTQIPLFYFGMGNVLNLFHSPNDAVTCH